MSEIQKVAFISTIFIQINSGKFCSLPTNIPLPKSFSCNQASRDYILECSIWWKATTSEKMHFVDVLKKYLIRAKLFKYNSQGSYSIWPFSYCCLTFLFSIREIDGKIQKAYLSSWKTVVPSRPFWHLVSLSISYKILLHTAKYLF